MSENTFFPHATGNFLKEKFLTFFRHKNIKCKKMKYNIFTEYGDV